MQTAKAIVDSLAQISLLGIVNLVGIILDVLRLVAVVFRTNNYRLINFCPFRILMP